MEAQTYIGRLIEVSNRKYKALEAMLQTYLEQEEALDAGETDTQEALIAKRQAQMDAIDKLDEEFHVYTERLKTTLGIQALDELSRFNFAGRTELKDIVLRITGLLQELAERHGRTETHLQTLMGETGAQIKQMGKSKVVSRAYQPGYAMPPPSVYFDKKK